MHRRALLSRRKGGGLVARRGGVFMYYPALLFCLIGGGHCLPHDFIPSNWLWKRLHNGGGNISWETRHVPNAPDGLLSVLLCSRIFPVRHISSFSTQVTPPSHAPRSHFFSSWCACTYSPISWHRYRRAVLAECKPVSPCFDSTQHPKTAARKTTTTTVTTKQPQPQHNQQQ